MWAPGVGELQHRRADDLLGRLPGRIAENVDASRLQAWLLGPQHPRSAPTCKRGRCPVGASRGSSICIAGAPGPRPRASIEASGVPARMNECSAPAQGDAASRTEGAAQPSPCRTPPIAVPRRVDGCRCSAAAARPPRRCRRRRARASQQPPSRQSRCPPRAAARALRRRSTSRVHPHLDDSDGATEAPRQAVARTRRARWFVAGARRSAAIVAVRRPAARRPATLHDRARVERAARCARWSTGPAGGSPSISAPRPRRRVERRLP